MLGFNPYRVFSSAETVIPMYGSCGDIPVSIPIGFSHQLRHQTDEYDCDGPLFQSLSGFLIS